MKESCHDEYLSSEAGRRCQKRLDTHIYESCHPLKWVKSQWMCHATHVNACNHTFMTYSLWHDSFDWMTRDSECVMPYIWIHAMRIITPSWATWLIPSKLDWTHFKWDWTHFYHGQVLKLPIRIYIRVHIYVYIYMYVYMYDVHAQFTYTRASKLCMYVEHIYIHVYTYTYMVNNR